MGWRRRGGNAAVIESQSSRPADNLFLHCAARFTERN
jgi:hypothetical protein